MNRIIEKEQLSESIYKIEVQAPMIARSRMPGHFIMLRVGKKGERIPLTIQSSNNSIGTITLIVQKTGFSSEKLCNLNIGDEVTDLVGPLGQPTEIKKIGTVLACAGGIGVAPLLPIIEAHKKIGNRVVTVMAARSKDLIILEDEVRRWSDEVVVMTDDGSYGQKGLVTHGMEQVITSEAIDECITIGPAIMMKFSAAVTRKYDIPTVASLNSIMVDGTGMCGACRVTVGNETKFTCVEGPEFDAHKVDFDELMARLGGFKSEEKNSSELHHKKCECHN